MSTATSSQKSSLPQWNRIDQLQDAFLPRFYEYEMPTTFRTSTHDDELDDGDFEYEATLMKSFYQEQQQQDKAVERLRQILGQLNPLYNTSLATTLNEHTDINTSSL